MMYSVPRYHTIPIFKILPNATDSENVKESSINRQKQRICILSDEEDEKIRDCLEFHRH